MQPTHSLPQHPLPHEPERIVLPGRKRWFVWSLIVAAILFTVTVGVSLVAYYDLDDSYDLDTVPHTGE